MTAAQNERSTTMMHMGRPQKIIEPEAGQVAYEAYREACPVSKFTGDKLPPWKEIDEELKPYWAAVESAVNAQRDTTATERLATAERRKAGARERSSRAETNKAQAAHRLADAEHRKAAAAELQAEAIMCIGNVLREIGVELAGLLAMARDGEKDVDIEALRRRFDGGV